MPPPKIRALQNWSRKMSTTKTEQQLVEDSTWMLPFAFTAPNRTGFVFKVGNKEYALDGNSGDFRTNTSELVLKRKYRCVCI
jgi:hypothetical protein